MESWIETTSTPRRKTRHSSSQIEEDKVSQIRTMLSVLIRTAWNLLKRLEPPAGIEPATC